MIAHTKETQATMSPAKALRFLEEGNERFTNNLKINRDLLKQAFATSKEQFPFATILSCIDSRVPVELVFDQGLGDVFSIRIAGNFINTDILGSMEFACKVAGSKLILVLGHTHCGAIKGACDNSIEFGNLKSLLNNIQPAIDQVAYIGKNKTSHNTSYTRLLAEKNVQLSMQRILDESPVLREMVEDGEIMIKGGMYELESGKVKFL